MIDDKFMRGSIKMNDLMLPILNSCLYSLVNVNNIDVDIIQTTTCDNLSIKQMKVIKNHHGKTS